MQVADLFCGAGGISEGFRLAGFEIAYGLDKQCAAVNTFRANHPKASVIQSDAADLNAADLPNVDVIVGGPPCVNFSLSKGGRANPLEGLRLVQAFLRIIYEVRPKYWIMENVPRIILHLPDEIPLRWIGVDEAGFLLVPTRTELSTLDFGVPQSRKRYVMGDFPLPSMDGPARRVCLMEDPTLGAVVEALPRLGSPIRAGSIIKDPIFGNELPAELLTDHTHDVLMSANEARRIQEAKCEHPYMGRMAFPDDLARPARTVVATQLGRETLVLAGTGNGYRRATVRECASLQSFPISYQFHGAGLSARYRLVGDAVPPLLSFALAAEIIRNETGSYPIPRLRSHVINPAPTAIANLRRAKKPHQFPHNRRFRALVPGKEVRGCRAEFDNLGAVKITDHIAGPLWQARLYTGEGKKTLQERAISLEEALAELALATDLGPPLTKDALLAFIHDLYDEFRSGLPDAAKLQDRWTGRESGLGPEELVSRMRSIVNAHFPSATFSNAHLRLSHIRPELRRKGLRLRIVAGLVAAAFVANNVNRRVQDMEDPAEILREALTDRDIRPALL